MRRIVVVATALAVLIAAATAYAAGGFNTYTATVKASPNKAGSSNSPAALAFTERYQASGTGSNRTAPLTHIKSKIYGIVNTGKGFPTCTLAKIQAAKTDTVCPKGSLVATGAITALLGPTADQSASNPSVVPCNPLIHAYNGGPGKVVYFFVDVAPNHTCANGAITTGTVGPFQGTIKKNGKNLIIDTPIPSFVSFPLPGVEGSLTSETLHWLKLTKKINGKTKAYNASVGCKSHKRPYSHTFTAEQNGQKQSATVSGTQTCS